MKIMKSILRRAGLFAAVLLALWAALTASAAIPNERIHDNMLSSALYFRDRQAFTEGAQFRSLQDNYADAILLNVAWNMGEGTPLVSALDSKYCSGGDYGVNWGLYRAVSAGDSPDTDYTRYWHGMAALVRPLLLMTDIRGIRLIGTVAAFILLAANAALLIRKKQYFAAGALAGSFLCVHIWNISLSMEYQPAVIVTLLLLPLYIVFAENDSAVISLAVISGVTIAFFDFLTAETLTILVPLLLIFIMRKQSGTPSTLRGNAVLAAASGGSWTLAYAGTFLVKWTAASLATGENKFISALTSAEFRLTGATELSPVQQFFEAPAANISVLFGGTSRMDWSAFWVGLLISAAVIGAVFYLFRSREKFDRCFTLTMLILGAIPFVRFFLMNNHSYLHCFFTYRALASSVLALSAALWYSMELSPKRKKTHVKGGKKRGN